MIHLSARSLSVFEAAGALFTRECSKLLEHYLPLCSQLGNVQGCWSIIHLSVRSSRMFEAADALFFPKNLIQRAMLLLAALP